MLVQEFDSYVDLTSNDSNVLDREEFNQIVNNFNREHSQYLNSQTVENIYRLVDVSGRLIRKLSS